MIRFVMRLAGLLLMAAGAVAVGVGVWFAMGGISAKQSPSQLEVTAARRLRSLAIPESARLLANPVAEGPEAIRSGLAHFADHCAVCHANDGSGDTEMGRGLYPRPPDMRRTQTQALSDGELFYIIENGVRLTGMPAWGSGTAESEQASWRLVHFIRHLPALTRAERAEMERLNPRGPGQSRELDPDAFLRGEDPPAPSATTHTHQGKKK
jgi:mono/diheme cytochrome c family protein